MTRCSLLLPPPIVQSMSDTALFGLRFADPQPGQIPLPDPSLSKAPSP
jgi:hypothetical protein